MGEELFGATIPIKLFRNRFVSTIIIIVFAAYLALWSWRSVWPVFGAANQLVAALALVVVTVLLMRLGKPIKYTFYPAMVMLITTIGALVYQVIWQFIPKENYLLAAIGVLLIILAAIMTFEAVGTARRLPRGWLEAESRLVHRHRA